MATRAVAVTLLLLVGGLVGPGLPASAQGTADTTQTDSVQIGSDIAETLEALRTLLQSTETELEQLETQLNAQHERTQQVETDLEQLRERVEGQLTVLSESQRAQRNRIQRLQAIGVIIGVVVIGIVVAAVVVGTRRLRALEALRDHVDRGVEQDDAEEPSQE